MNNQSLLNVLEPTRMNSLIYLKNIFVTLLDPYAYFEIRTYYLGFYFQF